MAVPTKQYGLILPQKKGASKSALLQKPSVFGDDSDEETTVGESLQREAVKKKMMKQTRLEMQKALEQDSTVYDYDGVYDDIQNKRLESTKKVLGGVDRKPKYIHQLLKAVDDRKKEQDRRDERKIQKEREEEGEQFADKEAYVTSAYRQKLEEQKEELEKEKREAAIEAALDVKKQKDLSGFYRHLLNQTVGEEAIPDRSAIKVDTSKLPKDTERTSPPTRDNIQSSCSDNEDVHDQKAGFVKPGANSAHSKRQYRQRSPSSGSADEREKDRDRHRKSHRDSDRDRDHRARDRDRDRDRTRGRERDDRHAGGRREDRDRRKERGTEREDRDRHAKRDRSPRDRHSRDKRKDEDKRRDKDREEEKEKAVKREEKEKEEEEAREDGKDKEDEDKVEKEELKNKFEKRSTDETVTSARDRYMARQMARSACKTYIEKEED